MNTITLYEDPLKTLVVDRVRYEEGITALIEAIDYLAITNNTGNMLAIRLGLFKQVLEDGGY